MKYDDCMFLTHKHTYEYDHDYDLLYFLAVFASCVLGRIFPSVPSWLHPSYMSYQPVPRTQKMSKAKMQTNQDHKKIGDLSLTLEKLYVWEKKLYEEVLVNNYLYLKYIDIDMTCF